ncbi:hypothetical protein [Candidatus Parabeggiatoa sp. HSG14]|uniref:hypothetical protein n=1 Tax=Candidatus Parabeggiatoa sp. HSG14 TaxID=3055593 RepID=UPI0025A751D3|nr:hypothetical protein [Thiotrichales bacterium HSG14]
MASIVAPVVVAIFQTHYEQWLTDESPPVETIPLPQPTSIIKSPKPDIQPTPPIVTLWLDSPDKTQFHAGDKVTLYYKFNTKEKFPTIAYFTLFNVSTANKWSIILNNEKIKVGKLYSLPKGRAALQPGQNVGTDARLNLTVGRKHFKAIVTPKPIKWETLSANIATGLQSVTILGEGALIINVLM